MGGILISVNKVWDEYPVDLVLLDSGEAFFFRLLVFPWMRNQINL